MSDKILESNKLIAEFMGTYNGCDHYGSDKIFVNDTPVKVEPTKIKSFKYHSSWDWLMPVVEKIENEHGCIVEMWLSLGRGCRICKVNSKGKGPINFSHESMNLIKCVHISVIEFIKYTLYLTPQTNNQ